MSGESSRTVFLVDDRSGRIGSFVRVLAGLPRHPRWVLVGGFAVNVRIERLHRLTNDIDTVSANQTEFVELLLQDPENASISTGRVLVGPDPQIEVDVMPSTDGEPLPKLPSDRAFALARRHALSTSEELTLHVVDLRGNTVNGAQVAVATAASLVIMKAVALPRRQDGSYPHKVGSDTHDLVRLALDGNLETLAATIAATEPELAHWVGDLLVQRFSAERDLRYSVARMRSYTRGVGIETLIPDDLELLGHLGQTVLGLIDGHQDAS